MRGQGANTPASSRARPGTAGDRSAWPLADRAAGACVNTAGGPGARPGRRGHYLLPLLLAACSSQSEPPPVAAGDEHIACAVAGSAQLAPVCAVERSERQGKLTLVVHHPDGAFRRFDVMTDGTGLAVADGAKEAATRLEDGKLEVTVGADRYVFPATAQ